ncbi:hypothetical protein TsFJ059_001863, partial [Trichoderma semiorbis]
GPFSGRLLFIFLAKTLPVIILCVASNTLTQLFLQEGVHLISKCKGRANVLQFLRRL